MSYKLPPSDFKGIGKPQPQPEAVNIEAETTDIEPEDGAFHTNLRHRRNSVSRRLDDEIEDRNFKRKSGYYGFLRSINNVHGGRGTEGRGGLGVGKGNNGFEGRGAYLYRTPYYKLSPGAQAYRDRMSHHDEEIKADPVCMRMSHQANREDVSQSNSLIRAQASSACS